MHYVLLGAPDGDVEGFELVLQTIIRFQAADQSSPLHHKKLYATAYSAKFSEIPKPSVPTGTAGAVIVADRAAGWHPC